VRSSPTDRDVPASGAGSAEASRSTAGL